MNEKLLKAREVKELFGISDSTLANWLKTGVIKAVKVANRYYFKPIDVRALLDGQRDEVIENG